MTPAPHRPHNPEPHSSRPSETNGPDLEVTTEIPARFARPPDDQEPSIFSGSFPCRLRSQLIGRFSPRLSIHFSA